MTTTPVLYCVCSPDWLWHLMSWLIFMDSSHCCVHTRPTDPEIEKAALLQWGQARQNRVHGRAAAEAEERVPGEPVHRGAATPGPGPRARPQRRADQGLVPEQAREAQEGQRLQERAGDAADGPGTVQPFHQHRSGAGRALAEQPDLMKLRVCSTNCIYRAIYTQKKKKCLTCMIRTLWRT